MTSTSLSQAPAILNIFAGPLEVGFHMSGESQTIGDFTVSRPSQILPTRKLEIVDIPDRFGWSETNRENRKRFYFPDASQIFAMVGDHSRYMKTPMFTVDDVGDSLSSLPIL